MGVSINQGTHKIDPKIVYSSLEGLCKREPPQLPRSPHLGSRVSDLAVSVIAVVGSRSLEAFDAEKRGNISKIELPYSSRSRVRTLSKEGEAVKR